jgi:glycosyltransferase involved in cell wall biosynthesis
MEDGQRFRWAPTTLSVILPAYNEAATIGSVLEQILTLEIPDVEIELIVVESNSTDGTKEIVQGWSGHPSMHVVWQDVALGKGNAVRAGLERATGDIVLIQDGDLEYRIDEYPVVIEPILAGEADFVLGSRHQRGQAMRVLEGQAVRSVMMNMAHWVFCGIFNATYGVRLRDPFTMFKVYRRKCLDGVPLVCDRFDFDWELAAKLIRLGHIPVEVPITYNSRSFKDGKKIRIFLDPPSWMVACVRFRFARLRPKGSLDETSVSRRDPP